MESVLTATVASSVPISPRRIACPSGTAPACARNGFESPAAMSFARSPSRRVTTRPRIDASVRTPSAPICVPMTTMTLPKMDQWLAMSTVARPVTHTTDDAVKRASPKPVARPSAALTGSMNSSVKARISAVNTRIANRDGEWRMAVEKRARIVVADAPARRSRDVDGAGIVFASAVVPPRPMAVVPPRPVGRPWRSAAGSPWYIRARRR